MLKERPGYLLSPRTSPSAMWTGLVCPSQTFLVLNRHIGHLPQVPNSHSVNVANICTTAHSIFICEAFVLHWEGDGSFSESWKSSAFLCKCWSLPQSSRNPLPCFGRGVAVAQAGSRRYHQVAQLSQVQAPAVVLLVKWRWIQWQWEQITLWVIRTKKASSH